MGILGSLMGIYTVEITSAATAELLTAINDVGIIFLDIIQTGQLTLQGSVYISDYKRLCQLVQSRGEEVVLLKKRGLYWTLFRLKKRPILLVGLVIYAALIFYIPTRVFVVRVEGNKTIPTQKILEDAERCGIYFGALRRDVRSEKMKNALLAAIPQLQWAGVNTMGCVAVISVEEKTIPSEKEADGAVSSIVARRDGIISEVTVMRGNALCKVGQAVHAGQVLVSGYTDCGISIAVSRAQAEIYAQTRREIEAVTPTSYIKRGEFKEETTRYSLLLGKKVINLFKDSGISDSSCVKMYKEYYLTLPGGFQLPVALMREDLIYYDLQTDSISQSNECSWLDSQCEKYILDQMVAGRILNNHKVTEYHEDIVCQYNQYACVEMIGQVRSEEIIKGNGTGN